METGTSSAFLHSGDRRGLLTRLAQEEHVPMPERVATELAQRDEGRIPPQASAPSDPMPVTGADDSPTATAERARPETEGSAQGEEEDPIEDAPPQERS